MGAGVSKVSLFGTDDRSSFVLAIRELPFRDHGLPPGQAGAPQEHEVVSMDLPNRILQSPHLSLSVYTWLF